MSLGQICRKTILHDRAITKSSWFLSLLTHRWTYTEVDLTETSSHCPLSEDLADAFVQYLQFSSYALSQLYTTNKEDVADLLRYFGCDDLLKDFEESNKLIECKNCGTFYKEIWNSRKACSFMPVRPAVGNVCCTRCTLKRHTSCRCPMVECPHVPV